MRVVPKADASPILYIPRDKRRVQAGKTFRFTGVAIFDRDLEHLATFGKPARCALTFTGGACVAAAAYTEDYQSRLSYCA